MPVSSDHHDYRDALSLASDAARRAGALLRDEFHRRGGPRGEGSHADIDVEAGKLICDLLRPRGASIRCEDPSVRETGSDPRHIWLIDPNDGTSAFLRGWRGSAVSIALLRDGVPVLGVVYAFCYPDSGAGDLVAWAEGQPLTRNGRAITPPRLAEATLDAPGDLPAIVFVSQDADRNPAANAACVRPTRYIALPSIAYRLARVAAGDGLAGVSLSGPQDWDYAAGHALLRGAGGVLVDRAGKEVVYAPDGSSWANDCFGGAPQVVEALRARAWESVRQPVSPAQPPYALVWPRKGGAVSDPGMLSRAQGCLLGQLAGDSLGGLVEFQDHGRIATSYPHGVRDLRDGGTWDNLAGQPTDDSEMALMLARTLVHQGRYHQGKVLDAYAHWWPHAWDRGGTLRQALRETTSVKDTAERLRLVKQHANQHSQANGCLMRISPLGIFGAGRSSELSQWARQDSQLTHPNPVCQESCAVFVAAIAHAVAHGGGARAAYQAALEEAGRPGVLGVVRLILAQAELAPPADYSSQMGWVLIALQNAFWQLLHAANLEEGVVDTVMRGGDTDTNAAIAGALLGAVHGRDAVPRRWQAALLSCRPLPDSGTRHPMPQEFWPVDALLLAEALLAGGKEDGK
jgi:ADP-ribosylglycohydrolase/fructose-1,6-bisphosphatase/inositol monophosphatase family enzyme